jgi:hypothetical protein
VNARRHGAEAFEEFVRRVGARIAGLASLLSDVDTSTRKARESDEPSEPSDLQ